jgi:hypothetical protein
MKRLIMKAAIGGTVLMSMLGGSTLTAPAAQAHFEVGGNCHINNVSNTGTVTFRITNRLYDPAHIYCGLRFNDGTTGYYQTNVPARRWITRRWHYNGPWTTVRINHVHVARL